MWIRNFDLYFKNDFRNRVDETLLWENNEPEMNSFLGMTQFSRLDN